MLTNTIYEHLKDIHQRQIGTILESATIIDPQSTVSHLLNQMNKNDSYDAFCIDGKSTLTTNLRHLLSGKDIVDMKVSSFLSSVPYLTSKDSIQKASNIMSHYRIRSVPIVEKRKIIGVVNAKKILETLVQKDNRWIQANLIFTKNPVTISHDEVLSTARKIMISKRIDHLPVEKNGKINQVLTSFHLVHGIIPHEGLGRRAKGMTKVRNLESKIGNIGSNRIPQCSPDDNLNTILKSMLRANATCCLVNLWDNLIGIITYRDILSLLAIKMESEIPLYIVGLPEDQKNVNLISSKLTKTLKRLQNVYSEIQEAKVSIKQQRSGSKKEGRYLVTISIITPHHSPHIYKEVGYDIGQIMENMSQKLLRNLSKRTKRRDKTSIRKINLPIIR